ncbi:NAD-specific glutamate dehydrogenase [Leucoagaricus sp. SymC.cos]|nr:NAD-specific glutamate dehydrogenase [Leucoagaricus sp. SymC.cos]
MAWNLTLVLLGIIDHAFNLLLGETALVVCDGDTVRLAGGLIGSGNVQDTVGINIEGDLNLRNTTRGRRNARKFKLAEEVVVLSASTLTLVDLDKDTRLVIGVGREDLGLLGGNGGVTLDEGGHDTTSGFNTRRFNNNIEQEEVLGLLGSVAREDSSLNSGTIGNSLIRVDALVGFLAVEEVGDELDDTGDTSGTTNKDDLVNVGFVNLGVTKDLLDGLKSATKEILAKLLETSTSEGSVEIDTLVERVNFDGSLSSRRESALGTLASGTETTDSTRVARKICPRKLPTLLVLALEFLDKVVHEPVVKIFTAKMGVTSSGLNLENTLFNGQKRDIESSSTKIKDEDIALASDLLVETVGDSSSSGLIDYTENVETSDGSSVFGSLTLGIIEISGNSDNGILDGSAKVRLGSLPHLGQDHGGNLLR